MADERARMTMEAGRPSVFFGGGPLRVRASRAQLFSHDELVLRVHRIGDGGRSVWIASELVPEEWDAATAPATADSPLLSISMEEAQQLMEDLWQAGVRPRDPAGTPFEIQAKEAHLRDLRGINDRLLGLVEKAAEA